MKYLRMITLSFLTIWTAVSVMGQATRQDSIRGVWKIAERTALDGSKIADLPPTYRIFTARYFSTTAASLTRPEYPGATATDTQKVEMWSSFNAMMGTYEVKGSELITRPIVAKSPGVMKQGYYLAYEIKIEKDILWIKQTRDAAGPTPNSLLTQYIRVE